MADLLAPGAFLVSDPETIREAADEILSRPEYQEPAPSLVDRAIDRVYELFVETLSTLAGGAPGGYLVGWILVAAVLVGIAFVLWRVMPRGWGRPRPESTPAEVDREPRTTRRQWLDRATAAEARGDWREATMARYRALVAGLVERHELDDSPGATTGEHRSRFGAEPDRGAAFDAVTSRFEDIWYGGQAAQRSDPERVGRADDEVLAGRSPSRRGNVPADRP